MGQGLKVQRGGTGEGNFLFNSIVFKETLATDGTITFSTVLDPKKLYVLSGGYFNGAYGSADTQGGYFQTLIYNGIVLDCVGRNGQGGPHLTAYVNADNKLVVTSFMNERKGFELYEVQ